MYVNKIYMSIQLFDKVCLFDILKNKTIIYGQYDKKFQKMDINKNKNNKINFNLVFCSNRPDFYIEIDDKINFIGEICFYNQNDSIEYKNDIDLCFPFEKCDLSLNSNSSIISTICKDYSFRLEEWIEYNLNLGFSGIVIFNNDGNQSNGLNESLDYTKCDISTREICQKYKGKVWVVDYNYEPIKGLNWNNLQRIALHIGVNAFQNKCTKIALIDADEFMYVPKYHNIEEFFSNYEGQTLTMQSNILTNLSNNDIINNNILDICLYVGDNKYTKTILDTSKLKPLEFIITPHTHPSQILLNKDIIIHYHCWVNSRCQYNKNMPKMELLKPEENIEQHLAMQ